MIKLESGNVLLKPSHRRQMMTALRRALRLGSRLRDFVLTISLHRVGRCYEIKAAVHNAGGDFHCRTRQGDLHYALRELVRNVCNYVHGQCLRRAALG